MSYPAYDSYKDSGVEWLGVVPKYWGRTALKRYLLTPVTDGPHETPKFYDEGVPFISAEAIKKSRINFSKKRGYISREDHLQYSKKYLPQRGDIYVIKSGATTGNVAMVETDLEFNIWSPLAAVRTNPKYLYGRYVFHYLSSECFRVPIELGWSFGTQQNIGMNVIENLDILRPPIDEQKAIAAFLDEKTMAIDALIAKKEKLLELLAEKRTALITQAVTKGLDPTAPMKPSGIDWIGDVPKGWKIKRLRFLAKLFGGSTPSTKEPRYWEGEIPWVSPKDMKQKYIRDTQDHLTKEGLKECTSGLVPVGTAMIVVRSGILQHTVPISINLVPVALNQDMKAFSLVDEFITDYFYWYVEGFKNSLIDIWCKPGTTVESIEMDYLKDSFVPLPSISQQEQIVKHLETEVGNISEISGKVTDVVAKLKEYRTALITNAVTGKIKVV